MTNVFNGLTDEGAAMTNVFDGLTDEQEFIVQALRRLMQPLLNEKIPSCCPFSIMGLQRMSAHNPKLYHQVAAYHNWPTDFAHLDHVATRIPCHGSVRGHQGLCDHATTLARKAPAFNIPAQKPPHPCDEDEESDDDDEDSRNLQAHVVLKHLYV